MDKKNVRDIPSDNQGTLLHMYSILVGRSQLPPDELSCTRQVSPLSSITASKFLPNSDDITAIQRNLVMIVSRMITEYIDGLSVSSKAIPKHIEHKYSSEMAKKSVVVLLDVLMKNEASRSDIIDIMHTMQKYLEQYPCERRVLSGGDQLTCERQVGAQWHVMDGDTIRDRLGLLEPAIKDWHCLVCLLSISSIP